MRKNYRRHYKDVNENHREQINNINDLKKAYYRDYCIDEYIKPIDYSESIKAIKPLSPLIKEEKRQMLHRNDKRNIVQSNDSFGVYFEFDKDYERMKQREKFIKYQQELLKQIEEKRRRLAKEKHFDDNTHNHHNRQLNKSNKVIYSAPIVIIDNNIEKSQPNLSPNDNLKSEERIKIYPQMMKYFEGIFCNLFKEQTDIIEEYKKEVKILKDEIEGMRQPKKHCVRKNEAILNTQYLISNGNSANDKNKEKINGILFKSKYEETSMSSSCNSLPGSSKLVKKIGDRHLIETWMSVNDDQYYYSNQKFKNEKTIKQESNQDSIMIHTQHKKKMKMNSIRNDNVCNSDIYFEEEKNYSINHSEVETELDANHLYPPSKTALRYNNQSQEEEKEEQKSNRNNTFDNNNISQSTYYNPNLPEIDLNQVIDFSKNDSSNIETDSENIVIMGNEAIKKDHNKIPFSSKNVEVKDSFMTKLTYFENASQIIHETIAKSSRQIVDNSKPNNTPRNLLTKQSELTQKEFFDHSLTTMNEFIKQDDYNNLRNTIETYSKKVSGTSYSKDL